MKKTKLLLSALVGVLLSFVMVFAVACGGNGEGPSPNVRPAPETPDKPAGDLGITDSSEEDWALLYIELVQVGKTKFNLGEEFDSTGLSVRAVFLNPEKQATIDDIEGNLERVNVNDGEYTVDSSEYNPNRVGIYTIYVSYTFEGVTRTATYSVSVLTVDPAIGGIVAELADGKSDTFTLTEDKTSVEITKDTIAVYAMEDVGGKATKSEQPLNADEYDVQLYLGAQEVANNVATENGVYSFVATLKEDESKQDFIPVYVVNPVVKIEIDATSSSKFEQNKSLKDEMTSTWQFTVTYANGVTKTVKAGAAGLTIVLDTNTVGQAMAAVTYVEKDGAGIERTVTCEVAYTIKAQSQGGVAQTNRYSLNVPELVAAMEARLGAAPGDKTALDATDFTGSNAFLTFVSEGKGTADQYRTSNGGLIEIKGDRLQVTFEGTGTITVSFASTGNTNESHFGLKDASGNYLEAATTTATRLTEGEDAGAYTVTGTSAVTVTYEITEAGTYTLSSPSGATNRGCRISAITMEDTVGGSSAGVTNNYSFNVPELVAAIEARLGAAPGDKTALDATDFTGSNAFLTFVSEGKGTADQYRTSNGGLIEIKGDRLQVTFEGTGTITVSFASTGNTNESHFGLKDASGNYLEAATTTATRLTEGEDAGAYTVTGTSAVTVTYEITEAGTYTLSSPSGATNRGCRISAITMQDIVGGGSQPETPSAKPLVLNFSDLVEAGTLEAKTYTEAVVLGNDGYSLVTVLASSDNNVAVESNSKSLDGYSFGYRLKLSGKGTDTARSIKIELQGAATVTVYMMSSSGSADRDVGLWTGTFDPSSDPATVATQKVGGASLEKHEYVIDAAGTYYLAAITGGTNVYGIIITPNV